MVQDDAKMVKDNPKMAQDCLEMALRLPKMGPWWPQDEPKIGQVRWF